jgi:hypothetical protein
MKYFLLITILLFPFLLLGQKKHKVKIPKKPLNAKVDMYLNRPTIFIDDEPQTSVLYALTDMPGGRWSWEELPQHNIEVFCEHGVRMYQLDISFEQMWKEDGSLDISLAQRQIRGVLEVCPDAAIFFRLHVNAPFWWQDQHKEELVVYADTVALKRVEYGLQSPLFDDPRPVERISLASKKWLEASGEMTALFCKKMAKTPEGRAVAGIQVACGVFGEWHYWGFSENEPDFSVAMAEEFRGWAKEKYETEAKLQTAWKDDNITFEGIEVPDLQARKSTQGVFRDPQVEQYTIDYYRCQHELVANHIIHFCKTIKDNWSKPIITGTLYGYFFSVFGREVAGGHLEFRKVLESEHVDYLSAPQCYGPNARKQGGVYRSRGLVTSCMLNKKLWLDEMDIEPNLPYHRINIFNRHLSTGRAATRRNMLYSLLKGMGMWFYDYGISGVEFNDVHPKYLGSSGWWDHPAIMQDIQTIKEIVEEKVTSKQPYTNDADVLFVLDTESSYSTASFQGANPMTELTVDWGTLAAFRSGVAFNSIHLGDLQKVNWEQYKVVVFGNTYQLSLEQKEYIKNNVAKDNRHLVWMYAPGFVDQDSLNASVVSELVGMDLKQTTLNDPVNLLLSPEPSQFLTQEDSVLSKVTKKAFFPAFAVEDTTAVALGHYEENGDVATAYKTFEDYTSWYIAAPASEEENNIMRYILAQTEAHRYIEESDAVVYAGWGLLFYYNNFNKKGEVRTVRLKNGKEVTFTLPEWGCGVLIDAKSGEILMEGS